jgi:hypothetical protein
MEIFKLNKTKQLCKRGEENERHIDIYQTEDKCSLKTSFSIKEYQEK